MKPTKKISLLGTVQRQLWGALLLLVVFRATSASANLLYDFTNQSDGVHLNVSGSLDPSSFSFVTSGNVSSFTDMDPGFPSLAIGPSGSASASFYTVPNGSLQTFGANTGFKSGTFVSGFIQLDGNGGEPDQVILPGGYVSGTALSASAIFPGTFATYGFPSSDVVSHLPGNQTITMHFSPVPDTGSALLLLVVGLGGVALAQWRRCGLAA